MSSLEMNSLGKMLPNVAGRGMAKRTAGEASMEIDLCLDMVPEVEQALSVKMDLVGKVVIYTAQPLAGKTKVFESSVKCRASSLYAHEAHKSKHVILSSGWAGRR
jgi:hypothetical protein